MKSAMKLILGSAVLGALAVGLSSTTTRRPEDEPGPDMPGGLPPLPPPPSPDPNEPDAVGDGDLPGVLDPAPPDPPERPAPLPGVPAGLVGELKPVAPPKGPAPLFGLGLKPSAPPKPSFRPDLGLLAPDGPGPDENWGYVPKWLIPYFQAAEKATRLAGFGRFLAVLAWHTARLGEPLLSDGDAYEWGLAHPNLNLDRQIALGAVVTESFQVLESNVAPRGIVGPYGGVGAYTVPLPRPAFYPEWGQIGRAGLFDLLGGYHVFAGIRDKYAPLLPLHASVLFKLPVQLFCIAYQTFRLLSRSDLELFRLSADDPVLLWSNVAQCLENTAGYLDGTNAAGKAFIARASECGIWLSRLAVPTLTTWPGSRAVYDELGGPK